MEKNRKNKGITRIALIIAVMTILILLAIGTFVILKKDQIFADKYVEGFITMNQSDFETKEVLQTISGTNLMEQDVEKMWYKVESEVRSRPI